MPEKRPRVLAILPALFPSTVIGVAKPLLRLHQDERINLDLTLQFFVTKRSVQHADVVVMCHAIDPQYGQILGWIRETGRPLIYELDDDLLASPEHIPGLAYTREPERQRLLIDLIRQSDVIRVYSPALQQKLLAHSPNVQIVSGPLDWTLVPNSPPKSLQAPVSMVYATSRAQDSVGEMLISPLLRVLEKHPDVTLTIWGPRHNRLAAHPQVRWMSLIRDYDTFFEKFAREGFDIGLAPLPDDEFHQGKSNNKFREYAACGIAGVYSDMSVYNTCVQHEQTGLLVANDDAGWMSAMERLIVDAPFRRRLGVNARIYAREHFNQVVTDEAWMRSITMLMNRVAPAAEPRRRGASADTAFSLARFVVNMGRKVGPVLRDHGLATVCHRTWQQTVGLTQLMSWEIKRRRLQRRISAPRGRQ